MVSELAPERGPFRVGQQVKAGFDICTINAFRRQYGQDGALVTAIRLTAGDGAMPHWVPFSSLKPVDI